MNCQVTVSGLKTAVSPHQRFGGGASLSPVLPLTLTAEENQLSLSSSDAEILLTTNCPATVIESGSLAITARILAEFVMLLKDPILTIEEEGELVVVKTERSKAEIRSLVVPPVASLQPMSEGKTLKLPHGLLSRILQAIVPAVGSDPHRPSLSGVNLWGDGSLTVVATDSFRLAEVITTIPYHSPPIVMLGRAATELTRALRDDTDSTLRVSEDGIEVGTPDLYLRCRSVAGQYPEYRKIIPSEVPLVAELRREDLLSSVKLAGLFSSNTLRTIRLITERESLIIRGTSEALGAEETKLQVRYTGTFAPLSLTVNAKYLLDGLLPLKTETVSLGLISGDQPVVIRSELEEGLSFLYLVMPLHDQTAATEEAVALQAKA